MNSGIDHTLDAATDLVATRSLRRSRAGWLALLVVVAFAFVLRDQLRWPVRTAKGPKAASGTTLPALPTDR